MTRSWLECLKIYQNILSAKNVYLAYIKDLENNIDSASVNRGIELKYGIGVIKGEIRRGWRTLFCKKNIFLKDRKRKNGEKKGKLEIFIPSKTGKRS